MFNSIDLRRELEVLHKEFNNWIIIRHLTDTKCNCWRSLSNTQDQNCPRCQGSGWLYKEWLQKVSMFPITNYRPVSHLHPTDIGKLYYNIQTVYLDSTPKTRSIQKGDMLFDIESTSSGKIIKPIKRIYKWEITDYFDLKLDNNKSEFIKLFARPLPV